MLRVFVLVLVTYKQELVELCSIWLHFSVNCFDMWSLARGFTSVYSSSLKRGQNNYCPQNRLNPGMNLLEFGISLQVMDNDTGRCWKQSKRYPYLFKKLFSKPLLKIWEEEYRKKLCFSFIKQCFSFIKCNLKYISLLSNILPFGYNRRCPCIHQAGLRCHFLLGNWEISLLFPVIQGPAIQGEKGFQKEKWQFV